MSARSSIYYPRVKVTKLTNIFLPQAHMGGHWRRIVHGPQRWLRRIRNFSGDKQQVSIRKSCGLAAPTRVVLKLRSLVFYRAMSLYTGTSLTLSNTMTPAPQLQSSLLLSTCVLSTLSCVDIHPVLVSLPCSQTRDLTSWILG